MDGEPVERDDTQDSSRYGLGQAGDWSGWPPAGRPLTPPPGYRPMHVEGARAREAAEKAAELGSSSMGSSSLTRRVHSQPAFGRPTSDQAERLSAYEQERDAGTLSSRFSRLW